MVAECSREETGVGPSIAFGNQEQKIQREDFVHALTHKKPLPLKSKKQKRAKSLTRFVRRAKPDIPKVKKRPEK